MSDLKPLIGPIGWLTFIYVPLLLMAGGGGSPAPLSELFCQVLAALALIAWVGLQGQRTATATRTLLWVTGLILAPLIIQLIPLPPQLWHRLPGRDLVGDALRLVKANAHWRPLSVAPQRTLEALLSLLPPLLAMHLTASLSVGERQRLLAILAAFAILSTAVGAGQIAASGTGPLHFYAGAEPGVLFGFQANRNAQVDVLLIGLLAAVAAWHGQARRSRAAAGIVGMLALVLLLGATLTRSRAGIALAPVALAWCLALRPWQLPNDSTVRKPLVLTGVLVATAGLVALVAQSRAIKHTFDRFTFAGEYRPDIWQDTAFAIRQFWPIGSGLGTFTRAIGPAERLEAIRPILPNRAHNEYLELLLEAGVLGAAAWIAVIALVVTATYRGLAGVSTVPLPQAVFAAGTLSIVTLHSLVDYPLRSMALAGLVGVAAALVLAPPRRGAQKT